MNLLRSALPHEIARLTRKLIAIILVMSAIAFIAVGCRGIQIASYWPATPILIDGHSQDWDNVPRQVIKKSGISCGVCNTDSSLCLLIRTTDEQLGRTIQQQGLTLWFDSTGKKKKTFGFSYRGKGPNMRGYMYQRPSGEKQDEQSGPPPIAGVSGERSNPPSMPKDMPSQAGLALLLNPKAERIPIRADDMNPPIAELLSEGVGYTFELSVPLSVTEAKYSIPACAGSVISIGIDFSGGETLMKRGQPDSGSGRGNSGGWGQPGGDRPEGGGGPGGMQGPEGNGGSFGPPGGGGGGGQGGPGGRSRSGSADQKAGNSVPLETWVQITLAQAQPVSK
jgi:hypothetical protein